MSYCSDVAIGLKADIVERFQQLFGSYYFEERGEKKLTYFWERFKQQVTSENGDVLYYWKYIKWEREFPEVDIIERFMEQLDRENLSEKYMFVRVGEEWDDVEYRGDCEDEYGDKLFYLEAVREIVFWGKSSDLLD